jgi:Cu+-exporting ATPase
MMTGEPIHRKATVNDQVLGGTIVSEGHLKFIVKNAGAETALSRMIDVIRSSAMHKPKIQRFGDKVSAVFVPVVVLLALTTFIGAIFLANESYGASLLRAIAVLVISCPCAMGLATPTAVAVAVGYAARNGMLIKGGDILERLNAVKTIVFDKTGTLTEGSMKLELMKTEGDAAYAQALIGTLEQYSSHPYAKTLHEKFGHSPIPAGIRFNEIRELKGQGVEALTTDGKRIRVGSATFTKADSHSDFQVFLTVDDKLIAKAKFSDPVRSEALAVIETLRAKGYRIVLLSGDQHATCARVAGELGIQEFFSEQLPDQKASKIKELQTQGPLVMVGDGINDAAAMAIADIGIAIGKGSSIALQTAEIVMHHEHPLIRLPELFSLAQRSMRTIRQNLFWALTYNVIAIPLAAAGMISPLLASLSMAFSDVVVIGNSLLLHIRQRFAIR